MQEWPPSDFNYLGELKNRGYREIQKEQWKKEVEIDKEGYKKCYAVEGYIGVFRDSYVCIYINQSTINPLYSALSIYLSIYSRES